MKRYDEESANDGCKVRGVSVGEDESHVLQGANPPSQIHNQLTFFFFWRGDFRGNSFQAKSDLMGGAFYSFSWQVVLGGRQMGV